MPLKLIHQRDGSAFAGSNCGCVATAHALAWSSRNKVKRKPHRCRLALDQQWVGPGGATLMDYSIYDALRAGFGKVVFIIRPDLEAGFQEQLVPRYQGKLAVVTAHQRLTDVPEGVTVPADRQKPWGTGQAVLAAEKVVETPFVVANADDFYGAPAFAAAAEFLRGAARLRDITLMCRAWEKFFR